MYDKIRDRTWREIAPVAQLVQKRWPLKGLYVPSRQGAHDASSPKYLVLGFTIQGLGFGVQGSGFRVQGAGLRVQDSGFRVQGSGL